MLLGKTLLPIAIDDNTFVVQLTITRNIIFPVVLDIEFLQKYGGVIGFPNNLLYFTKTY